MHYIIVVAACGYVFLGLRNARAGRYLGRDAGWDLVYKSFLYGSLNIALAYGLWQLARLLVPELARDVRDVVMTALEQKILALGLLALPMCFVTAAAATSRWYATLASTLGGLYEGGLHKMAERFAAARAAEETILAPSGSLWQLLYEHIGQLVLVTMENRKVYIGFLFAAELRESIAFEERTMTLVVFKSGYRDVNTLKVVYTTDYSGMELKVHLFIKNVTAFGVYDPEADSHFAKVESAGVTRPREAQAAAVS